MIVGEGYIETLNEQEAIEYGNYIVVTEEITNPIEDSEQQING